MPKKAPKKTTGTGWSPIWDDPHLTRLGKTLAIQHQLHSEGALCRARPPIGWSPHDFREVEIKRLMLEQARDAKRARWKRLAEETRSRAHVGQELHDEAVPKKKHYKGARQRKREERL